MTLMKAGLSAPIRGIRGRPDIRTETTADYAEVADGESDGRLFTPPIAAGILEGITRDEILAIARDRKIEVREENLTRQDLYVADECFLTGTAAEVIPVVIIDKRTIGTGKPGPVTKRLAEEFHRRTRS